MNELSADGQNIKCIVLGHSPLKGTVTLKRGFGVT